MNGITIRINGRTVGIIRGSLLDVRRHTNGFLSKPPAIALSVQTLETARQAGVEKIEVRNLDSGATYRIPLSDFVKHCWRDQRGKFEPQLVCALDRWTVTGGTCPGDFAAAFASYDARQEQPGQMALFG